MSLLFVLSVSERPTDCAWLYAVRRADTRSGATGSPLPFAFDSRYFIGVDGYVVYLVPRHPPLAPPTTAEHPTPNKRHIYTSLWHGHGHHQER